MPDTDPTPTTEALRRLQTPAAQRLAALAAASEELQTVLRCCERLMTAAADRDGEPDDILIESMWTVALLSYARCFADGRAGPVLTERDLTDALPHGDVLSWHTVLLQLRDHQADRSVNPRERFSVGVAQDGDGSVAGIAITSVRQPLVDRVTVQQTGAIAYALGELLERRIDAAQAAVLGEVKNMNGVELDALTPLDIVEPKPAQPKGPARR